MSVRRTRVKVIAPINLTKNTKFATIYTAGVIQMKDNDIYGYGYSYEDISGLSRMMQEQERSERAEQNGYDEEEPLEKWEEEEKEREWKEIEKYAKRDKERYAALDDIIKELEKKYNCTFKDDMREAFSHENEKEFKAWATLYPTLLEECRVRLKERGYTLSDNGFFC